MLDWASGNSSTGYGESNVNTKFIVSGELLVPVAGDNVIGSSFTLSGGSLLEAGASAYGALVMTIPITRLQRAP